MQAITNFPAAGGAEVEQFISQHALSDNFANRMRMLDPRAQSCVLNWDLSSARDTGAVIAKRISHIEEMGYGDWICPSCLDIQFKKNTNCRKCGTAVPHGARNYINVADPSAQAVA